MKGIVMHCNRFNYADTKKSTRPKGIQCQLVEGNFKDSVVVFTCIEKSDTENEIKQTAERVDILNKEFYNRGNIVVVPFVHLSNKIAHPEKASQFCNLLAEELRKKYYKTHLATFGSHKRLSLDVFGHRASVSYFEFPYKAE